MMKFMLIIESVILTILIIQIMVILFQPYELYRDYPKKDFKERWNDLKFSAAIAFILALHMIVSHLDILRGWVMIYE